MNERRDKKWNETKTNDSWSIFKIMGEFVEGYEKLAAIGPCISIFGSARTHPDNKFYKLAEDISQELLNVDMELYRWWTWNYGGSKQRC